MRKLSVALLAGLLIFTCRTSRADFSGSNGFITANNPANGIAGSPAPTTATQVAGRDGLGVLQALSVDSTGKLNINSISGSISLPAGASTSALQSSILTALGSPMQQTGGSLTANAGTNLNTSLLALESGGHLASVDLKLPALGQALAAGSVPVVLTAAQLATLTPLSTVTVTQATGTNLHAVVDSSALPSGAATSAAQATAQISLSSIDGKLPTLVSGHVPVDGSGVTQPMSAVSLPLPTGASTAAKQPALGTAGTASADVLTVQGIASMTALKVDATATTQPISGTVTANIGTSPSVTTVGSAAPGSAVQMGVKSGANLTALTLGMTTAANSLPVAIASDQTVVSITQAATSGSMSTGTVSTATTVSNPGSTIGFILQNDQSSTANIRYAVGGTATGVQGIQLAPGQDSGFVPVSANISVVAESGTQTFTYQWIIR